MTGECIKIAVELDVFGFIDLMAQETGTGPDAETALVALHKARCELAKGGHIPEQLGVESGEWLCERSLQPGIHWSAPRTAYNNDSQGI